MKIEGVFSSIKAANETVERLKSAGFNRVYIDMKGLTDVEMSASLSDVFLDSGMHKLTKRNKALRASNPMVSVRGRVEDSDGVNCRVVVEADDEDKVKQVASEMGGEWRKI